MDRAQLYEIIALVGLKTISNFINHVAHTAIDRAFAPEDEEARTGAS